jgi:hypothetical protein
VIYLYAVTEAGAGVPRCRGLDDQPVRKVACPEVAGLCSEHSARSFPPHPDAISRHEEVVEAAMRLGPVLPARFGTTFTNDSGLLDVLGREQGRLRRGLERVRGCVELAVRVELPAPSRASVEDGLGYVRTQLVRRQEREAVAARTLQPLAGHAVRTQIPGLGSDLGTLRASYLVREDDVPRFADEVRALADRHSDLSLSCTGPWAPYSFVGDE